MNSLNFNKIFLNLDQDKDGSCSKSELVGMLDTLMGKQVIQLIKSGNDTESPKQL